MADKQLLSLLSGVRVNLKSAYELMRLTDFIMTEYPDYPGKAEHGLVASNLLDLIEGYEQEIKELYQKVYEVGLPENSPLLNPPKYEKPTPPIKANGSKKKNAKDNGE